MVVSAFLRDTRGVAQAGRLTLGALTAAGVNPIAHDITPLLTASGRPERLQVSGGVWLMHCNAPESARVLGQCGELSRAPVYRIGYWAWELPRAPREWLDRTAWFHEIWTPSTYVAAAFAGCSVPIRVMPHPVPAARSRPGRVGGVVNFLTFADLRSSAARKNPVGAVEAYMRAFPRPGSANLVIKLSAADADRATCGGLQSLVAERPDIQMIDGRLSEAEVATLVAESDVLLSLHRAEGYGLVIAEAMASGKAVVATGWSGNVDFVSGPLAAQLVPYTLTPVSDPAKVYAGQEWAEPDLDAAAALMRRLVGDPGWRARLGRDNRTRIAQCWDAWSPEALSAMPHSQWLTAAPPRPEVVPLDSALPPRYGQGR